MALVTGVSRGQNIGSAIALELAGDGWDIATVGWRPYDERMPWRADPDGSGRLGAALRERGARALHLEVDLALAASPASIFDQVESGLGSVTALILAHCESVATDLETTSVESFDLHFAVNARATWLLIREFARRFQGTPGSGRVLALTSDHTTGNLPYGASKGALDRIVISAARELGPRGITANVINPGPTDTGWMSSAVLEDVRGRTPLGRIGQPADCANLVGFLCSEKGGWVSGQLLYSNGGFA